MRSGACAMRSRTVWSFLRHGPHDESRTSRQRVDQVSAAVEDAPGGQVRPRRQPCIRTSRQSRTGAPMKRLAMFIAVGVVVPAITAVRMSSAEAVAAGDAGTPARIVAGLDEPLVPTAPTSPDEDSALDAAIAGFRIAALLAPDDP